MTSPTKLQSSPFHTVADMKEPTQHLRKILREELSEVFETLRMIESRLDGLDSRLKRLELALTKERPASSISSSARNAHFQGERVEPRDLAIGFQCLVELHAGAAGKKWVPVVITGQEVMPNGAAGWMASRLTGGPKNKWRKIGPKPASAFFRKPEGWKDDADADDEEGE